jgi:hypothetical protein
MSTATTTYEPTRTDDLLGEILHDMGRDAQAGLSPVAFQARSKPATTTETQPAHNVPPAPRSRVLPRLLAMGDTYFRAGSLRQALDLYFDLARNHPETPEATEAEDRILELARLHEENGELHLARAIYEQMI